MEPKNKNSNSSNSVDSSVLVNWTPSDLVEVILEYPDDFLKIKETLTRIGVASRKDDTLYQSCHILHKQGRYYIVHFKELFLLDGKPANISQNDVERRNTIVVLLSDWDLLSVIEPDRVMNAMAPLRQIKIIPFKEKEQWTLVQKYTIGGRIKTHE